MCRDSLCSRFNLLVCKRGREASPPLSLQKTRLLLLSSRPFHSEVPCSSQPRGRTVAFGEVLQRRGFQEQPFDVPVVAHVRWHLSNHSFPPLRLMTCRSALVNRCGWN